MLATARELFECRHFPSVVAACTEALRSEPACVPLILLRAQAHVAMRRELDAQADLRAVIRLEPRCGLAYRLLGELAARRDEHESAAIFFREALRLDPGDHEAMDWLQVVAGRSDRLRPAAGAKQLPAPAPAAGRVLPGASRRPGSEDGSGPRLAKGTNPPAVPRAERPTRPFARGTNSEANRTPSQPVISSTAPAPALAPMTPYTTAVGRLPPPLPAKEAPRLGGYPSRPARVHATPELPGFGEYLVETGILTRERLRAAQAYQRSMKVQLSTAIVTLGLATAQRIEWAAVSHQSQLSRER